MEDKTSTGTKRENRAMRRRKAYWKKLNTRLPKLSKKKKRRKRGSRRQMGGG